MNRKGNGKSIEDSATDEHVIAVKNGSFGKGRAGRSIVGDASDLRVAYAAVIYVLFMLALYWPVFFGQRFFWEDFFTQEYPIREFCFYMARWKHQLPFWNPYSWAWSPLLADAQNGFWYPTNLLQIAVTWLVSPHAIHLPVIVPETMTLLHLPLAALGAFVLSKKEFRVSGIAALVAGLCWGFGVRMAAEQNHSMQIIQLALLPWEVLLLMRSWKSWRYAIALGLLFGVSFFAGQPQTFFYIAIFLGAFTLAESLRLWRRGHLIGVAAKPLLLASLAMIIAAGISTIQLLPTLELVRLSAREHLTFSQASAVGLHLGHFIDFFVPKFYGEYPGFTIPKSPVVNNHYWYWEATFYWGALAEILALFGLVSRWKERRSADPKSRYLFFFAIFSALCLAYGMGANLYFQWPFWRFLPLFDHFRAPNRMIWFVWFIGTILTGIGLENLLAKWNHLRDYRSLFLWSSGVFVLLNLLSITGVFDLIFPPYTIRAGLWLLLLPSLIASVLTAFFFILILRGALPARITLVCAVLLIAGDLFYNDFTWHRNTLDRETVLAQDSLSAPIVQFRKQHGADHSKLLVLYPDSIRGMRANDGMFLRLPIENASDANTLRKLNPLCIEKALPPARDPVRRMELMGVATAVSYSGAETEYPRSLPFLKLYHEWMVASGTRAQDILNDSTFDFSRMILLAQSPNLPPGTNLDADTAMLQSYSENSMNIRVSASRPSVLFVNDLYYPAWRATVDGKDTKILRAFTSLRAIPVSAGIHSVVLCYDSAAFDIGWKITLGTALLSLLALLMGRIRKNPDKNRGSSS